MADLDTSSKFLSFLANDYSIAEDMTVVDSCILGALKDEISSSTWGSDSTADSPEGRAAQDNHFSYDFSAYTSDPCDLSLSVNNNPHNKVEEERITPGSLNQIAAETVFVRKFKQEQAINVIEQGLQKGGSFIITALVPTRKHAVLNRQAILEGWGAPDCSMKTLQECKKVVQKCGLTVHKAERHTKAVSKRIWLAVFDEMKKDPEVWGHLVKKVEKRVEQGHGLTGYLASKIDISSIVISGQKE